jgi:hypothetical protein
LDLDASHSLALSLRTLAADNQREESVSQHISQARQAQASGDLIAARSAAEQGLATYPNDGRLVQLLATLNKGIGESRRRSLEELKHLVRDASTMTDPGLVQTNLERARSIASQHPGDEDFETLTLAIKQRQLTPTATISAPARVTSSFATSSTAASGGAAQPALEPAQAQPGPRQAAGNPSPITEQQAAGNLLDQATGSRSQHIGEPAVPELPSSPPQPSVVPGQPSERKVPLRSLAAPVAKSRTLPWIGVAAGFLILALAGLLFRNRSAPQGPSAAAPINLEIRTNPPGARVLVDGEPKGVSNLSLALAVGAHEIRAELEGYEAGTSAAKLSEGTAVSRVEINLKPVGTVATPEALASAASEAQTPVPTVTSKSRPAPVVVSAKSVAPREEVALKPTLGILVLKRSPTVVQVSIQGSADLAPRPVTEDRLELLEGPYTLTATAPGYAKATVPAAIEAGKTREIVLELQPAKTTPADWKVVWERPDEWKIEGGWLVRRGGNFVLSTFPAKAGSYSFTLWRKGKSAQWVVNYRDQKNYCLFEIDSKSLSRTVVRNGKKGFTIKVPHSYDKQTTYTLQVSVSGNTITHKLFDGKSWLMLDELKFPGTDSRVGRFGMFVPGKDQVGLSHITFKPI